jgi:hypothetical protein
VPIARRSHMTANLSVEPSGLLSRNGDIGDSVGE